MAVLDFLRQREARRNAEKQTDWQRYRELLESFVNDDQPAELEAAQIIEAAGKSESELATDVETLSQRKAWRAQIEASAKAQADKKQAEQAIAKAQASIDAAQRKHQPTIDAARLVIDAAFAAEAAALIAGRKLRESSMDPTVNEQIAKLKSERRELGAELAEETAKRKRAGLEYVRVMIAELTEQKEDIHRQDRPAQRDIEKKIQHYKEREAKAAPVDEQHANQIAIVNRRKAAIESELESLTSGMQDA